MTPRLKCVVIDDDPDWIDLIYHALAPGLNVELIRFAQGLTALDYLRRERVDVVVSDLRMPVIDGLTLIAEFRHFDETTPVILVSSDQSVAEEALACGANAFVRKGEIRTRLAPSVEALVDTRTWAPR